MVCSLDKVVAGISVKQPKWGVCHEKGMHPNLQYVIHKNVFQSKAHLSLADRKSNLQFDLGMTLTLR